MQITYLCNGTTILVWLLHLTKSTHSHSLRENLLQNILFLHLTVSVKSWSKATEFSLSIIRFNHIEFLESKNGKHKTCKIDKIWKKRLQVQLYKHVKWLIFSSFVFANLKHVKFLAFIHVAVLIKCLFWQVKIECFSAFIAILQLYCKNEKLVICSICIKMELNYQIDTIKKRIIYYLNKLMKLRMGCLDCRPICAWQLQFLINIHFAKMQNTVFVLYSN